jgi:hypothetical protein
VLVEDILETCPGHRSPFGVHEQLGHRDSPPHRQPGTKVGDGFFPERKAPFLPTLPVNADARRSLQGQVLQREPHQFGNAQAAREAEVQHRTVPNSESRCDVWRGEDGAHFVQREMPHERLVVAFPRDGVDLPRLCQGGGHAELDIPDEGFDCGEPSIARGRAVAALFLNVSEEVENQRGVELLEADL